MAMLYSFPAGAAGADTTAAGVPSVGAGARAGVAETVLPGAGAVTPGVAMPGAGAVVLSMAGMSGTGVVATLPDSVPDAVPEVPVGLLSLHPCINMPPIRTTWMAMIVTMAKRTVDFPLVGFVPCGTNGL